MNNQTGSTPIIQAIAAARALNDEELRQLYDFVLPRLKAARTARSASLAQTFRPRDVVQFRHNGRMIKMQIERINLKTVSGKEVRADGSLGSLWRVSPQLLERLQA